MAATTQARRLASPAIRALLLRRLAELGGLALGLGAVTLAVALVCYNPLDPSLNTATSRATTNLAGPVGAVVADFLLQGFGVAAGLPVVAALVWAWRIASHRGLGSFAARLASTLGALLVIAAVAAALPLPSQALYWPTAAGPGGAIGDVLAHTALSWGRTVLGPLGAGFAVLFGVLLAAGLFWASLGLSAGEWRAAGRAAHGSFVQGRRAAGWLPRLAAPFTLVCPSFRATDERVIGPSHFDDSRVGVPTPPRPPVVRPDTTRSSVPEPDPDDDLPAAPAPTPCTGPARKNQHECQKGAAAAAGEPAPRRAGAGWLAHAAAVAAEGRAAAVERRTQRGRVAGQRPPAGISLGRVWRAGHDPRDPARPGGHVVRAGTRTRHPQRPRDRPGRRRGAQPVGHGRAHRYRAGPQRDRHRGAERQARDGLPVRVARRRGMGQASGPAGPGARQEHRRRPGAGRPGAHAASAGCRHHRLRQVGRHQRDDPESAVPAQPRPVPADPDRPEDARTLGL